MLPANDDRVTVALSEYHTLRGEILASLGMQQTTLSFSTLALGGVCALGFHANGSLPLLVFLVVLPMLSYVSLFIWLGEYARTTRAGCFLMRIEARINELVGAETLTWERFLRTPVGTGRSPQYAWNAKAIFSFYALVPLVSSVAAALAPHPHLGRSQWLGAVVCEVGVWAIVVLVFLRREFDRALVDAGAPVTAAALRGAFVPVA
jgi:hypothetical protein